MVGGVYYLVKFWFRVLFAILMEKLVQIWVALLVERTT